MQRSNTNAGDALWRAVLSRDRAADGLFVYAVRSTGIFCRPSCPSRRPRRENVEFFPATVMAVEAGFRPCQRCRPERQPAAVAGLARVCEAIARRPEAAWTAASLTRIANANTTTVRRWFRDRLGVSPREFVAACRRRRFLAELRGGAPVGNAVYAAGYGSSSRVYERADTAVTPATYRKGGRGAQIEWTSVASPIGTVVVGVTARGVCFVAVGQDVRDLLAELRAEYPHATIVEGGSTRLRQFATAAVAVASARPLPTSDLPADVVGTAFQWRVWRALCRIPIGQTLTYAQLAEAIGAPTSVRAAARACATNPIALLVPCHRVVGSDGTLRGFRWGLATKQALLDRERAADAGR